MIKLVQSAALAVAVLATGASAVSVMSPDLPDLTIPKGAWVAGSTLDGQSFGVTGTVVESGETLPETVLSFKNGKFQSSRCQVYCDFGWTAYQTKQVGDVVHFTATAACPDAPHTVVWHGVLNGDAMQVAGTWTTRRWYWTQQVTIDATGRPVAAAPKTVKG